MDRPVNVNVIENKWVFDIKEDSMGNAVRYKARLVAKGYSQEYGIDFWDTYSPVTNLVTVRILLDFSAKLDLELKHLDVSTAFLYGNITEDVYMEQPVGFMKKGNEDKVCKLHKSLYGLKQAPREWNKALVDVLAQVGFCQSDIDPCLLIRRSSNEIEGLENGCWWIKGRCWKLLTHTSHIELVGD